MQPAVISPKTATDGGLTRSRRSDMATPTSAKNRVKSGALIGAEHRVRTGDLRLGNEAVRHPRFSTTLPESARTCDFLRVLQAPPPSPAPRIFTRILDLHVPRMCHDRAAAPRAPHSTSCRWQPYSDVRPRTSTCCASRASCPTPATSGTRSGSTARQSVTFFGARSPRIIPEDHAETPCIFTVRRRLCEPRRRPARPSRP